MVKTLDNSAQIDAVWADCINVVLGLLEDNLQQLPVRSIYADRQPLQTCLRGYNSQPVSCWQPNRGSLKRRQIFTDTVQDCKHQKTSTISVNYIPTEDNGTHLYEHQGSMPHIRAIATPRRIHRRPRHTAIQVARPILERSALPGMTTAYSIYTQNDTHALDQWLCVQAQRKNQDPYDYKQAFLNQRQQLFYCLSQLRTSHYTQLDNHVQFDVIQKNVMRVLEITDELEGDHSKPFAEIIPEWPMFEEHIGKLASYVKCIEDFHGLMTECIPRTGDLLADIQQLQSWLEMKKSLYGDNLAQCGAAWKEMGLCFDQQLISSSQEWFCNVCIDLLSELETEYSQLQARYSTMTGWIHDAQGEKAMDCILCGVEFVCAATSLAGTRSLKLISTCQTLAIMHGRWAAECFELLCQRAATHRTYGKSARVDIRFLQIAEYVMRLLTAMRAFAEPYNIDTLQEWTAVVVDIVLHALSVLEFHSGNGQRVKTGSRANIMTDPQMTIAFMTQCIIACAERVVELAGRDTIDGPRVKRLHNRLNSTE